MGYSLYVHIPWCLSKCPYCDFNSHAAAHWPEEDYVRALLTELRRRAGEEPFAPQRVSTIFFGGGTPSLFSADSIARIIEAADEASGLEADAEITLEANPGTVDKRKLAGFRAAGVNRISFGAQSFDDERLKFLGRIHRAEDTRRAVRLARAAGFKRINLDLIFAVPGETAAGLKRDIEEATALGPDHISAYNLTFEEGTAFFGDLKAGRIRQLSDDEQARQFDFARQELPRHGYRMYEISNYAPPGHEVRHNLTYWRADSYLGIGAGAHSFARDGAGGRRWANERVPGRYMVLALGSGGNASVSAETVEGRRAAGEFVFLNLRLREGFSLVDFARRFGTGFHAMFGERARSLIEGGLLLEDDGLIRLSDRGVEIADSVFAEFL